MPLKPGEKTGIGDEEFLALFVRFGGPETARQMGISLRNVYKRRQVLERKLDTRILGPNPSNSYNTRAEVSYPSRLPFQLLDGVLIAGSDAHYWPDEISTAHRGLVHLTRELQPKLVCLNGDGFDGARISRHPPIGWSQKPTVRQEIDAVEERTDEIRSAAGKSAKLIWTLGNHDLRFENRLADRAPEYEDVRGFSLKEQFPHWQFVVSLWVNNAVVIKHRFKGGIHATHNNALWAGMTMITGHLHSLKVTPLTDYTGTRWGVDTGTLTKPSDETEGGPQVDYNEDNPQNHRSGFVVLTFHKGKLLWPEIARAVGDSHIDFRGKLIKV